MGAFGNPGSGHGLDLALRLQLFQRRVQNSERFVEPQFDPAGTGGYSLQKGYSLLQSSRKRALPVAGIWRPIL